MNLDRWGDLGRQVAQGRQLGTLGRRMAPGGMAGTTESASPLLPSVRGMPVPAPVPGAGEAEGGGGSVDSFFARGTSPNAQLIADGVETILVFDDVIDTCEGVAAATGGDPGVYALAAGHYSISAGVLWEGTGAGDPGLRTLTLHLGAGYTAINTAEVVDGWAPKQSVGGIPLEVPDDTWVWASVEQEGSAGGATVNTWAGESFLRIQRVAGVGAGGGGVIGAFHFAGSAPTVATEGTAYDTDNWALVAGEGTGAEATAGVITVTESGWYDLSCTALWQGAMTGIRVLYYLKNGAYDFDTASIEPAAHHESPHVFHNLGLVTVPLAAGDTIGVGYRTEGSGDQALGLQLYVKRVR